MSKRKPKLNVLNNNTNHIGQDRLIVNFLYLLPLTLMLMLMLLIIHILVWREGNAGEVLNNVENNNFTIFL